MAVGRTIGPRSSAWTAISTILVLVCYFLMPTPPTTSNRSDDIVNINYVYGLHDDKPPQTWMPPLAWLSLLLVGSPLCLYLPTHLAFRWLFRRSPSPVASLVRKLA